MDLSEFDLALLKKHLIKNNRTASTVKSHLDCFKFLVEHCPILTDDTFSDKLLELKERYSSSYLNNIICTVKIIGKLSGDRALEKYPLLPNHYGDVATMSDEEIEAFLKYEPEKYKQKNHDDWTMFFTIMAYTGMRPGEVADLTIDDVDFGRSIFIVREKKHGHVGNRRYVPIPPNISSQLNTYVKNRVKREGQNCHLFVSVHGSKFDNVDWSYQFHNRLKKIGLIRKGLRPYSLRHSFVTAMLNEDVNIFKVQKIVGHRQLSTTARYTHLTTKDIQMAIRKHPGVAKATNPREKLKALREALDAVVKNDPRFTYDVHETEDSLDVKLRVKK